MPVDISQLKEFYKKIDNLPKVVNSGKIADDTLKELGAKMLRMVKERTPVGKSQTTTVLRWRRGKDGSVSVMKNKDGTAKTKEITTYTGGTLRRNWKISKIIKDGDNHYLIIYNNIYYASYVEFGHRQQPGRFVPVLGKRLKAGYVKGHYMMTNSAREIEKVATRLAEKNMKRRFDEVFKW